MSLAADLLVVQVCEFLDVGDAVHRFHGPSRALSRLPGVVVIDIDLHHRLLPQLAETCDVLVLAGYDWDFFPLLERRRAAGHITVLEANDYYFDIQGWNPLLVRWLDRSIQDSFVQGMKLSDGVQTSMPELARRWRLRTSREVIAFPNELAEVPELKPPPARPLTIGWGGSPGHFADWYDLAPCLQRWLDAHPDVHLAVMNNEYAKPFFRLPPERYHYTDFGSLAAYLRFLEGLDIGLAPMLPSGYNRCRSDVKFLEYASRGVAGIYANLDPYQGNVVHGETGLLYRTEAEFLECLDLLASDVELRQRIRRQAHAHVSANRRLDDHIGQRLAFYRRLLPRPPLPRVVEDSVLEQANVEGAGRYLQLRRREPEETLLAVKNAPPSRESFHKLAQLVERHPNYLYALQHLGRLGNDLRDSRRGLPYLERALALDPNSARTRCEMGRSFYLLDDVVKARRWLEDALTLNPYYQLGWQYLLRFLHISKAKDGPPWVERAHQANPANFALALLGVPLYPSTERVGVLRRLLDFYEPQFLKEELPAAAAAFSETFRDTAGPYLNSAAGIELLRRGCAVFPHSAQMANLLGMVLRQVGQVEEAEAQHARALDLRQAARTFQAEFPKEEGSVYLWQFAEHIRKVKPRD
jgi:tetratricopeptide (TPR) repeat protein